MIRISQNLVGISRIKLRYTDSANIRHVLLNSVDTSLFPNLQCMNNQKISFEGNQLKLSHNIIKMSLFPLKHHSINKEIVNNIGIRYKLYAFIDAFSSMFTNIHLINIF